MIGGIIVCHGRMAEELKAHLKGGPCDVRIYHRDLYK